MCSGRRSIRSFAVLSGLAVYALFVGVPAASADITATEGAQFSGTVAQISPECTFSSATID